MYAHKRSLTHFWTFWKNICKFIFSLLFFVFHSPSVRSITIRKKWAHFLIPTHGKIPFIAQAVRIQSVLNIKCDILWFNLKSVFNCNLLSEGFTITRFSHCLHYVCIALEHWTEFCVFWMYHCVFKVTNIGCAPTSALMRDSANLPHVTYVPSHLFLSPSLPLCLESLELEFCMWL